jgi:hypothetical protein
VERSSLQPPSVDRSRLAKRIVASGSRVVTLTAPAGYGKSRLAHELGALYGGLRTIDCSDATDPLNAVALVIRALAPIEPKVEEQLGSRLLSFSYANAPVDQIYELVRDAFAGSSATGALCLDNMEVLADRAAVAHVFDTLVRSVDRTIILCSRVEITLPAVARTAPNDRYDVGISELQFTPSESEALFRKAAAATEDVASAIQLARGWPIAVLTFVRFAREGTLNASLSRAQEGGGLDILGQYMLSQALHRLSEPVHAVLCAIARIGIVSVSELQYMIDDAATVLTEIRSSPFCIEAGEGLSLHPLARAALRTDPAGIQPLRRAALACAGDSPVRAARFYLALGDDDAAATVLDTRIAPYLVAQPSAEMAALIADIRPEVLVRHQATWSSTMTHRSYAINLDTLLYESRLAFAALPADASADLRIAVAGLLLNFLIMGGRHAEAQQHLSVLSEQFSHAPEMSVPRVVLRVWDYFLALRLGKLIDHDRAWEDVGPVFGTAPASLAQWLYCLSGPIAFYNGDRDASRRAFDRTVTLAAQPGMEIMYVIALKNAAFHAWLAGDHDLFAALVRRLAAVSAPTVVKGTQFFVGCALEPNPADIPTGVELLYTRAFAALVAAERETEPRRRGFALRTAVDAALEDGQPWLIALVHLARGLAATADRTEDFATARRYAKQVEYAVFRENVELVISGSVPDMWSGLRVFQGVPQSRLVLEFGSRTVVVDGTNITLARREIELLLALTLTNGARDRQTLAAMVWPDLDEIGAQNAVRVLVSRLRTKIADAGLIRSTSAGYELTLTPDLDLFAIESALANGAITALSPPLRERLGRNHERLPQWMLTNEWLAPYIRRYEIAISRAREAFAAEALRAGRIEEAARWQTLGIAEDDEGVSA